MHRCVHDGSVVRSGVRMRRYLPPCVTSKSSTSSATHAIARAMGLTNEPFTGVGLVCVFNKFSHFWQNKNTTTKQQKQTKTITNQKATTTRQDETKQNNTKTKQVLILQPWSKDRLPVTESPAARINGTPSTFINLVVILGSGRRSLHRGDVGDPPRPVDVPVES